MNENSDNYTSVDTSSSSENETTRNFEEEARTITHNLLPTKSNNRYTRIYQEFMIWKQKNKVDSFSENILLVYFNEISKHIKPNTMWSKWSMLKSVLYLHHGININKYEKLKSFLKKNAQGFVPKKSKVLTWENIMKFLDEAEDHTHLANKVILIFGLCGALRTSEICNLMSTDVEDSGRQLIVSIKDTKNNYPRSFIIQNQFYNKVKMYMALRPKDIESTRFFLHYINGRCVRNVIGKNKIGEIPKKIAEFLQLKDPHLYTGHCFRRTAATLLANSGATSIALKQLGGWRSDRVAEGYVENSLHNKKQIFNAITYLQNNEPLDKNSTIIQATSSNSTSTENTNRDNSYKTSNNISCQKPELMEISAQHQLIDQSTQKISEQNLWPDDNDSDSEWFKSINLDDFSTPSDELNITQPKINKKNNFEISFRSVENCQSDNSSSEQSKKENVNSQNKSAKKDKNPLLMKSNGINLEINQVQNLIIHCHR